MTAVAASSAPPYVVRELKTEDLSAVLDLMRVSLGETMTLRRSSKMWHWKHEINPFGRSHVLIAEEDGGRIIGLRAFLNWEFKWRGQTVQSVRAVDTATHPDFQRMGLFSNLTNRAVQDMRAAGVHMVFNTPNDKSRPGYLKMGWQLVGPIKPLVKVLNYQRFALAMARTFVLKRPAATEAPLEDVFTRGGLAPVDILVGHPGLDTLVERDAAIWGPMIHTRRSRSYLEWRYAAHPTISYRAALLMRNGSLEAAAILRANSRFGLREVVVAELLLSRPDPALAKRLLADVRREVRADYIAAYFPHGTIHRGALSRSGYRQVPSQGMVLTRNSLAPPIPELSQVRLWGLTLGDLELF